MPKTVYFRGVEYFKLAYAFPSNHSHSPGTRPPRFQIAPRTNHPCQASTRDRGPARQSVYRPFPNSPFNRPSQGIAQNKPDSPIQARVSRTHHNRSGNVQHVYTNLHSAENEDKPVLRPKPRDSPGNSSSGETSRERRGRPRSLCDASAQPLRAQAILLNTIWIQTSRRSLFQQRT